jgi:Ferritin-like domain
MQITSRQFRSLAADVDDLHNDNMKSFAEETADLHLDAYRASRRGFIAGSAGLVGAVAIGSTLLLPRGLTLSAAAAGLDDATIAGYAQSVELAAVAAYKAAAPVLSKDTLPVAELFMSHHQDHADAFGAVAGAHAVTEANPKLLAAVGPLLAAIKDEKGALEFAFVLEGQAAYTYAAALTLLVDPAYAAATATILPIEAQHQTVLGLALGKSVDDCFPTGAFESTTLGDGTDPLAGLDPAVFG